ncbi:MAG: alpha-D-glucose phosphate-specific phosphoglucomutase [Lentisphaerae bacterium]|nr:alpha-D-glucose phosphate-specific phosphoglucomutase [Lentisphaerota bacterium]
MQHHLAGKPVPSDMLVNIPRLISLYYTTLPDCSQPAQRVVFGTSGHRGSSLNGSFTESHILAITQAICDYRRQAGTDGPLFLGMDTHALSEPAHGTALCVLAANGVQTRIARDQDYTPTPVLSHSILSYNRDRKKCLADGIVITPSHNPPEDGGIKYNPTHGGPAESDMTKWIADTANAYMKNGNRGVKRLSLAEALKADCVQEFDFRTPYVADLDAVIDMAAIARAGIRIGADALGGAGINYWRAIAEHYGLDITVINGHADPSFRFMPLDHDGRIRMDCSSPFAMRGLIRLRKDYDIAFGNDPDFDRHGIVTPSAGLMNPNHYLAVAIQYLFSTRTAWPRRAGVGKSIVSSNMIDKVAAKLERRLVEVPVGFKWFVSGLLDSSLGFGGEESAGASFLRKNGRVWTTDKDGIILALLAAEITAVTGRDPAQHYQDLVAEFGETFYGRIDSPATPEQKAALAALKPEDITAKTLGGDAITAKLTRAAGNQESIGGLKLCTANGWVAIRPSGTENTMKVYAESMLSAKHLKKLQKEAAALVN